MISAVLVGIVLPVGLLAWAAVMATLFPDSPRCGHLGCLGFLQDAWETGRWVAIVVAWPLLRLLRVRPSWPVAVLGAVLLVVIWQVATALSDRRADVALAVILLSGTIAYPAAVLGVRLLQAVRSASRDGSRS
jgi:hypothetical protein